MASPTRAGWEHASDVDRERYLAPRLLSNLLASVPNARIKGVYSFVFPGDEGGVSGWIDFDSGEGTPPRHIFQLQISPEGSGEWTQRALRWALSQFRCRRFAAILKGSMRATEGETWRSIEAEMIAGQGALFDFDSRYGGQVGRLPKLIDGEIATPFGYVARDGSGRRLAIFGQP